LIEDSGAAEVLNDLKAYFTNRPFFVSDVVGNKEDNRLQYVDLAQQGGGVWGIALIGATYILEVMGIRFFVLAGTSAGAVSMMS
jgi:NTE family protein